MINESARNVFAALILSQIRLPQELRLSVQIFTVGYEL